MGEIIRFPARTCPPVSTAILADRLAAATAQLPGLLYSVGAMGRTAEELCNALQASFNAMDAAFDRARSVNEAHKRLQAAAQQAIILADSNPDAAAVRLAELRADYARLVGA